MYAIKPLGTSFKQGYSPDYKGKALPPTKVIYTHRGTYSQMPPIEDEFLGDLGIEWGPILTAVTGLGTSAAQIVSATKGPAPVPVYQVPQKPTTPQLAKLGTDWTVPIAIGVGGLVLVAVILK